jgi:hypothetical protein
MINNENDLWFEKGESRKEPTGKATTLPLALALECQFSNLDKLEKSLFSRRRFDEIQGI